MKILVVDNDELILAFMSDILKKEGHEVITAEDGLSALDRLKSYSPDVIFTDLVMPNIGGKKLCEIIRGTERLKDVYLIIISAIAAEEEINILEMGANACMAKGPFDEMAQNVLALLDQSDRAASQAAPKEVMGVKSVFPRRTTEELLSVKKHFEVILERMSEGILEITSEGRIFFANPVALSILDMPEEELLGSNFVDVFRADDRQRVDELLHKLKGEPKAISNESPLDLNGHQVTLSIPPIDEETTSTIVILNDVTERKRSEAALKKAHDEMEERVEERTFELLKVNDDLKLEIEERKRVEAALRESEEKYRSVLEANPDPVSVYDMEGRVIYISPAFTRVFGWTLEECIGKKMDFFVPEQYLPETQMIIDKAKAGEGFYGVESQRFTKGGDTIDVSLSAAVYRDSEDNPLGSVVNFQDITEEKRLRQESEYRLQQVIQADKLASLGEVVAGVAHEINNPNSFITYNIPLLEETWRIFEPILSEYAATHKDLKIGGLDFAELCEDVNGIIQDIKTGTGRIRAVVDNLKDFSRPDKNSHAEAVQVNEVIEKALTIVGAQIRKSIRKVEINLADTLPEIIGHQQKLEQVVANLLVNASHAILDKYEGRIAIASRCLQSLNCILIEVEDNGIGMPPEVQKRIFEPFFTTRRDEGGTGLGLSVSYGLIKEHNGIIGVLSRPGLGSRFTLFLPIDLEAKLEIRPTILYTVGDVSILSLLRASFVEIKDMPLEAITTPDAVIAYLEEHPEVDIVLSGIEAADRHGWALIENIKTRFPLVAVILVAAHPDLIHEKPDDMPQHDGILTKPFEMDQLLQTINRMGRQRL